MNDPMPLLTQYTHFLTRVDELGFMSLSHVHLSLPSLSAETPGSQWHTGDRETDPWCWKDRAAAEKELAYGCILGGHKGFIAPRLYPLFYAACRPQAALADRWEAGEVSQTTWQLWQLFVRKSPLDTGGLRKLMGVTASRGAGRVDTALRELQRDFYITVTGSRRKIGRDGQPYGWAASTFAPVPAWFPPDWLASSPGLDQASAREQILDLACGSTDSTRGDLARVLGW
jgi:hypothetical protein